MNNEKLSFINWIKNVFENQELIMICGVQGIDKDIRLK